MGIALAGRGAAQRASFMIGAITKNDRTEMRMQRYLNLWWRRGFSFGDGGGGAAGGRGGADAAASDVAGGTGPSS